MNNKNSGHDLAGNTAGEPLSETPANSAVEQHKVRGQPDSRTDNEQSETKELAREFRVAEKWAIGINAALAIIGLIALIIYYGQLRQMKKATKATEIAAKAAKDSVTLSRNNAHLDQRAWLGIENIRGTPEVPETNKAFDVAVLIRNSGRTPAKNVFMQGGIRPLAVIPKVETKCAEALKKQDTKTMIPPNAVLTLPLHPTSGEPLTEGWDKDLVKKGKLYVYGCVIYDDVFDKPHWLTFCGVLNMASKGFDTCKQYNDTGDGPPPK